MLFINLDLITELMAYSIHKCNKENKLLYYDDITNASLKEDISFNKRERNIINNFCELEMYRSSLIGNTIAEEIRMHYSFSFEKEKEFFTKLFVRYYLAKTENRTDPLLEHYLSEEKLFADVAINEKKEKLTGIQLFIDFASPELKNDKEFAKVILQLDGSYITAMGERVRNSASLMEIAINNDETSDVLSFVNSDSKLLSDSEFVIHYLKQMKENQGRSFSVERVYENIFKQEEGKYSTTVFKNNEQSLWMQDRQFLPRLAKIDSKFVDLISEGKIAPLSSDLKNKQIIKK